MFVGTIKWSDTFEGETSENMACASDTNGKALAMGLLSYLEANDELVYFEIRLEDDDA